MKINCKVYRYFGGFKDSYESLFIDIDTNMLNYNVVWIPNSDRYTTSPYINLNVSNSKEEERRLLDICLQLRLNYIPKIKVVNYENNN